MNDLAAIQAAAVMADQDYRPWRGDKMNQVVMAALWKAHGIPEPVAEYRFHPVRLWRFDFAWPALKLALEIEGGVWTRGRHTRGRGFMKDMEKYNSAVLMGWAILRGTPEQIDSGEVFGLVREAIGEFKARVENARLKDSTLQVLAAAAMADHMKNREKP